VEGHRATLPAIEDVYRRRCGAFLRVAVALLPDRELARDAVQEAFARAVRGRVGFRGETTLEAWIWQVLVNHCRDLLRRPQPAPEPSRNSSVKDWPEVRAAISALPERQRLVLFLRHYADLDYRQIAEAAGIETGTVGTTLHAARAALRKTIGEEEP
jgi:RNA polymerase sigma-70 factor (ECF subfamily)